MPSALETLVKILKLEQETGYKNTAVIGGLESFADNWERDAHEQAKRAEQELRDGDAARQCTHHPPGVRVGQIDVLREELRQNGQRTEVDQTFESVGHVEPPQHRWRVDEVPERATDLRNRFPECLAQIRSIFLSVFCDGAPSFPVFLRPKVCATR